MPAAKIDPRTVRHIVALETALARRDPGTISGGLAALLDADFVERGASGRRWDRAAVVAELDRPPVAAATLELDEFALESLAEGVVLLTYRSVDTTPSGGRREVRRVSIWIRRDRGWRVRFHQGTPVPSPNEGRAE